MSDFHDQKVTTAKVAMRGFLISKVRENSFRLSILELIVQKNMFSVIWGLLKIQLFLAPPRDLQGVGVIFWSKYFSRQKYENESTRNTLTENLEFTSFFL